MIYEKWTSQQLSLERPDFVIIGAGPVGIILALKLAKKNKKVLLIEGGGENYTDKSQARYKGDVNGFDWAKFKYMDGLRLRYLGGTTNHWVGYCVRLDQQDLKGWPITFDELYKNSAEVESIFEITSFDAQQKAIESTWPHLDGKENYHQIKPILKSPPVRFKTKYHDQLKSSQLISVYLDANLVDVNLSNDTDRVDSVSVASQPGSDPILIKSKKVVFCMGAIETTRYMLILKEKHKNKSNWNSSLIGKGFMEHPHYDWDDPAAYVFSPKGSLKLHGYSLDTKFSEMNFVQAIVPTVQSRETNGILNYAFTIFKPEPTKKTAQSEVAFYQFMSKMNFSGSNQKIEDGYDMHMVNLQTEMDATSGSEIVLNPAHLDDFGLPRISLNMVMSDPVRKTVKIAIHNLQREFLKINAFLFRVNDKPSAFMGGAHPMGTTRMGLDVASGFVDENLKIFGLENAYICGGSVFYSGGYANPTFTIMSLTVNLADHLASEK